MGKAKMTEKIEKRFAALQNSIFFPDLSLKKKRKGLQHCIAQVSSTFLVTWSFRSRTFRHEKC